MDKSQENFRDVTCEKNVFGIFGILISGLWDFCILVRNRKLFRALGCFFQDGRGILPLLHATTQLLNC